MGQKENLKKFISDNVDNYSNYIMYLVIALLSACVFVLIYGIGVLNPTNVSWLLCGDHDLATHYLGWKAFRASSWKFPIGMMDTLSYPYNASIIFTDSIPLWAVIFKILSPILPENFQYFGLWGLFCFVMQGILTAKILRIYSDDKISIALISILSVLSPIMIYRMFMHTALAGQWILLYGIFFFLKEESSLKNDMLRTCAMGLIVGSTHLYLACMCGIILVGKAILIILNKKKIATGLGFIAGYIVSIAIALVVLGGFSGSRGLSAGGLGENSFNLNGFINPVGWSYFFRDLPVYVDAQKHEGFAYLGAGVITLLIISLGIILASENIIVVKNHKNKVIAILVVMIISLMVSLSPIVTLNEWNIFKLRVPKAIYSLWEIFRATGRFAWMIVYLLLISSALVLLKKANRRVVPFVLVFILFLQAYDIKDKLLEIRGYYALKPSFETELSTDEFWDAVAKNQDIKHVVYYSDFDRELVNSVDDWALSSGKTLNEFFFAHGSYGYEDVVINALNTPDDSNIVLFSANDEPICLEYGFNYYKVDNLIVASTNEIQGFKKMDYSNKTVEWSKDENLIVEGETLSDKTVIHSSGALVGPYWNALKGEYTITIIGNNLDIAEFAFVSDGRFMEYDPDVVKLSSNEAIFKLTLGSDVEGFEIVVRNKTSDDISVEKRVLQLMK